MTLPNLIRVRISSEHADMISMMPVVVQEMRADELIGMIVAVTAKDVARLCEILARGSFLSGGSRLRWEGFEAQPPDLHPILASFPDADPARQFNPSNCIQAVFHSGSAPMTLSREVGIKRKLFRRQSFWDVLMQMVASPAYVKYSYREQADLYRMGLSSSDQHRLAEATALLPFAGLASQIKTAALDTIDLFVKR